VSLEQLASRARAIIDENRYLTLGTADQDGTPWANPVYFTPDGYSDFYWVSSPEARHSRNIAARPEVGIVLFDSTVRIGTAEAVYLSAVAAQVPDDELERCSRLYSARFPELRDFPPEHLRPPALFRLYRARATEHSVLVRGSDPELGTGVDSRVTVTLEPPA
jgi:nitroimidazol reductase NimA-like FMN-containing flavoprotein (pyridoxamine 5'-phosphate oxidase superfamily)